MADAPKILIADDDAMLVELAQAQLETDGYDIQTTVFGQEALGLVRSKIFAVVVTDNQIGDDTDGVEIAGEALKSGAKAIIYTGRPEKVVLPEALTGKVEVLKKPGNIRLAVQALLEKKD